MKTDQFTITARDASDQIISRVIAVSQLSDNPVRGVMPLARNMLRIKGCARVEIHDGASQTPEESRLPLRQLSVQDLYQSFGLLERV
jgi:hypothetical protein